MTKKKTRKVKRLNLSEDVLIPVPGRVLETLLWKYCMLFASAQHPTEMMPEEDARSAMRFIQNFRKDYVPTQQGE